MHNRWPAILGAAAVALALAACGASTKSNAAPGTTSTPGTSATPAPPASRAVVKTMTIGGVRVLTDAKGFTLYWFGPDTSTTSRCTGGCAAVWPPLPGPATAGPGVTGTLGTLTRSGGAVQASYDGHPLYTYTADTAPGQASGDGINLNGGVWHEATVSGSVSAPGASATGGGYRY